MAAEGIKGDSIDVNYGLAVTREESLDNTRRPIPTPQSRGKQHPNLEEPEPPRASFFAEKGASAVEAGKFAAG